MNRDFYVYVLFRPWDGSPCYVGKGSGKRWRHFSKNRNPHLLCIIAKAGGKIPHVKIRDGLTESEGFAIEAVFIKAIGRGRNGPLVNMTDGGDGVSGLIVSAETRAKMSKAHKGRVFSEEHKANLRVKNSDETRRRKSVSATGRILSADARAKISMAARKRTHSEETRAKMSAAKLGRIFSEETKARMRAAQKVRREREGEKTCLQVLGSGSSTFYA
jgi:hypothetical protein